LSIANLPIVIAHLCAIIFYVRLLGNTFLKLMFINEIAGGNIKREDFAILVLVTNGRY